MPKLFKLFAVLFSLFWVLTLVAQQNPLWTDADPNISSLQNLSDIPGDVLAVYDVEAITGENGNLGVEYAFGYLWVTARGLVNPPGNPGNQLWKIDISSGTPVLVDSYLQGTVSAWGWRDLTSDGTYLYASDSPDIQQIDPTTGYTTGVTIPGPISPNRALAYDPATDHFWTISFGGDLYEIDRAGTIINQFPNPASTYGAGWDPWSPGGPFLWLNGGSSATMVQVDPLTGIPTGVNYSFGSGLVGGLSISVDLFPGLVVGIGLSQETPDQVYVVELDVPVPVEMTSFAASISDGDVILNWSTATETNNQGFDIERNSGNGFEKIGFVAGFGTTTENHSYSYVDGSLQEGTYTYRLKQMDYDGTFEYSDAVEVDVTVPKVFSLEQNYPNPFNPSTMIKFSLAADSRVTLTVFDILGQEVANLISGNLAAGSHEFNFDASNLNSGVYFYRIDAAGVDGTNFTSVKKMILTK